MRWWAILYWIFALGLFGVFVMRRVKARRGVPRENSILANPRSSTTRLGVPGPIATTQPRPSSALPPLEREWPAPPPPEPGDDTWRLDPTRAADEPTEDNEAFTSPAEGLPPSATLPELLAGITLPHELVPLTQIDANIDLSTHVVVATQKANAETVRAGLTGELERLGYTIEHESMLRLMAHGPRGVVRIEIHADGATVVDGGVRRFPTAAEGSVVVELFAG